jgi:hypothetical protein
MATPRAITTAAAPNSAPVAAGAESLLISHGTIPATLPGTSAVKSSVLAIAGTAECTMTIFVRCYLAVNRIVRASWEVSNAKKYLAS